MSGLDRVLTEHELVGIDAQGELCSCGVKDPAFVEHLADVLAPTLGVARYWPRTTTAGAGVAGISEFPRIGWEEAA